YARAQPGTFKATGKVPRYARDDNRTLTETCGPGWPSARPGQRPGFHVGEALHRLQHAFLVAQARILDAAEGRHFDAIARYFPDIDRADLQLVDESGDVVQAIGADARRQPIGRAVGDLDRVIDVLDVDDRDGRAEGFLAHQLAGWIDMVDHRGRKQRAPAIIAVQQLGAVLGHGLADAILEQGRRTLVDH